LFTELKDNHGGSQIFFISATDPKDANGEIKNIVKNSNLKVYTLSVTVLSSCTFCEGLSTISNGDYRHADNNKEYIIYYIFILTNLC